MSRSTQPMKELTTGLHLVTIDEDVRLIDGSVRVRFIDGFNKSFEQDYSLAADKIFILKKLCAVIGIDIRTKGFDKAIPGKRLWIAIKEVHEGESIDYFIFDVLTCDEQCNRPIVSGDPIQHPKGVPMGVFIEHKNMVEQISEFLDANQEQLKKVSNEMFEDLIVTGKAVLPENKLKAIAEAKEMIKKVEAKEMKSLNQPNNSPKTVSPDWDDF